MPRFRAVLCPPSASSCWSALCCPSSAAGEIPSSSRWTGATRTRRSASSKVATSGRSTPRPASEPGSAADDLRVNLIVHPKGRHHERMGRATSVRIGDVRTPPASFAHCWRQTSLRSVAASQRPDEAVAASHDVMAAVVTTGRKAAGEVPVYVRARSATPMDRYARRSRRPTSARPVARLVSRSCLAIPADRRYSVLNLGQTVRRKVSRSTTGAFSLWIDSAAQEMVELTIEQDIRNWALTRPGWQQDVLVALSRGETYDGLVPIAKLADRLLQPNSSKPNTTAQNLTLGAAEPKQVVLRSVCNVKSVNALASDQTLAFAPHGLTILYGNNGSGKSGYARVIKAMVSARHSSLVLPDVYQDGAPDPSAEVEYSVDDQALSEKFPADPPVPDLQRVRFYDEHCGDEYLSHESSVTYRPSALTLLDGLIAVCGKVREELQRRITENNQKQLSLLLPQGTTASTFLVGLSVNTTDQQIDDACTFTSEDADKLGKAIQEVARLETSDASKERARLKADAREIRTLETRLAELENAVSADRLSAVDKLKGDATTKRAAATVAAATSFDDEPLSGVGSETWRALWRAARDYALSIPGHGHDFKGVGDGARCMLCQQPLDDDAKDRFTRFNTYMTDTTESDAATAERLYDQGVAELRSLDFATQTTTAALTTLREHNESLATAVRERLGALEERRDKAVKHFTADAAAVMPLAATAVGAQLEEPPNRSAIISRARPTVCA